MRDLILLIGFFGLLPVAFARPIIGALLFAAVSLANPHRLTWGMAYDMPLAQLAALTTIVGAVIRGPTDWRSAVSGYRVMLAYALWMLVTTMLAIEHAAAVVRLQEVLKVHLMVFLTLALVRDRRDVTALACVIVVSIGFYGVKGGLFTIAEGGQYRVWGPPNSNITENNSLAVALLMTVPLIVGLRGWITHRSLRFGSAGAAVLCGIAALGSHSRGGALAAVAMLAFLWWKSKSKVATAAALIALALPTAALLPDVWWDRMASIGSYDEDSSALGRLNTWRTALNVANDRPTGAGFEYYKPAAFSRYSPDPSKVHSAHSIYFQALGEHGWFGLTLFLSFWGFVWFRARSVVARARERPDWDRERHLVEMAKVSMVAFAVGGAFLNLGNWDGAYYIALVVLGYDLALRRVERTEQTAAATVQRRMLRPAFHSHPAEAARSVVD